MAGTAGSLESVSRVAGEVHMSGMDTVIVEKELFYVRDDEELGKLLVRPPWSLIGAGATVEEAKAHLMREARDLAVAMEQDDPKHLTREANRMREYVMRIASR